MLIGIIFSGSSTFFVLPIKRRMIRQHVNKTSATPIILFVSNINIPIILDFQFDGTMIRESYPISIDSNQEITGTFEEVI
jgi:hypothetical protein